MIKVVVTFRSQRRSSFFQRAIDICESLDREKQKSYRKDSIIDDGTKTPQNKRKRASYVLPSLSPTNSDDDLYQTKSAKFEDPFAFDDNMNEVSDEELECFILSEERIDSDMDVKIRNAG